MAGEHPLFAWLAEHLPDAHASLRPPASTEALERAEGALGQPLPEALVALFRQHDGQESSPLRNAIFDSFRFMSVDECLEVRVLNTQVLQTVRQEFPDVEEWPSSWLPFAEDGLGNSWVVDVARGDVFEWAHDEGRGTQLGETYERFLDDFVESLARGERVVDPRIGIVRRELLTEQHARAAAGSIPRGQIVRGVVLMMLVLVGVVAFIVWLEKNR